MINLNNIKISNKIVIPIAVIGLIGGLSLYFYFSNLYKQSQVDALVGKARAVVLSAESAREYTADQAKHKVFQPGANIPELKDLLYTVPIFSAMQVAAKKSKELGFTMKVPKNSPRNPDNQPDDYEKTVLAKFSSPDVKEFWEIDKSLNSVRYFRPVVLTEECMACHGDPAKSKEYWGRSDGKDVTGTMMEGWKVGEVHGAFEIKMSMAEVDKAVADSSLLIAGMAGGMTLITILIALFVSKNINSGLDKIRELLESITHSIVNGKLDARGNTNDVSVDFRPIVSSTNSLIDSFVKPINVTAEYVDRISKGDLPPKIIDEYKGDFNEIKHNLNQLIDNLDSFVKDMNNMSKQHELGEIDIIMNDKLFYGCYQEMALGVNQMVNSHIDVKKKAMAVVAEYGNGNFNANMEILPGKKIFVNNTINKIQNNLNNFISEMNNMSVQHELGEIDVFVNDSKFEGSWKEMAIGVNQMVKSHIDVKKRAMAVVEEYGNGNFDAKMDILPGKKIFINNILDKVQHNLMTFGDDTELIIEQIKNGKLDVRNNTAKYQGDWKGLANGINEMLEAVIKPINVTAEYIDRISKGDLPNRIEEEYKGDFNEIKVNLNNLIETNINLINSFQQIANGDLSVKLTPRSKQDDLIASINELTNSLSHLVRQIAESVEQTSSSAYQMATNADSLTSASQEQAAQTDEVAGAVEEMSRTVTESAFSAGRTAEVAQRNGDIARNGGQVVEQTITKMREIASVVMNSASNIQKLGESSQQIGEIISVIDDIADQTNLLALNAAIEAARAGEQGRGFAVVADEVRKLAERTTAATKQIANMIKGIQKETEGAVQAMNTGSQEVQNGINLADEAGESLGLVVSSSQEVLDMINQIVISSEQQAATSEQIAKNVISISRVTGESTQRIEEIAQASDELTKLTEHLKSVVSQFRFEQIGTNMNGHTNFLNNLHPTKEAIINKHRSGFHLTTGH